MLPGYSGLSYRNDGVGGLHLSGIDAAGATTVICSIPVNLAPAESRVFMCVTGNGHCSIKVDPDGAVKINDLGSVNSWLSFDASWPVQ